MHALNAARHNGELHFLWGENCIFIREEDEVERDMDVHEGMKTAQLSQAVKYFNEAAMFAGPASNPLSRKIMRSLALATGPKNVYNDPGMSAAALIHTSIGSRARQVVSRAFSSEVDQSDDDCSVLSSDTTDRNTESMASIFSALDTDIGDRTARNSAISTLYRHAERTLPAAWNFVATSLCPSGEILMSSIRVTKKCRHSPAIETNTICIFPDKNTSTNTSPSHIYDKLLKPFDQLMEQSRAQLSGTVPITTTDQNDHESDKRRWWNNRETVDKELEEFLKRAGEKYFSASCIKKLVLQDEIREKDVKDEISDSDSSDISCGNLASKFEEACTIKEKQISKELSISTTKPNEEEEKSLLQKMTVVQLKKELEDLGVERKVFRNMRKASLVDLLFSERQKATMELDGGDLSDSFSSATSCNTDENDYPMGSDKSYDLDDKSCDLDRTSPTSVSEGQCTFLILDEELQRLPFECFELFSAMTISRIPSIPFAIASLMESQTACNREAPLSVDPVHARYVVDPESNLANTKSTLLPVLNSMSEQNDWKWDGMVGEYPSSKFMESSLERRNGFFLYCGHGGGERFFTRSQVERVLLNNTESDERASDSSMPVDSKMIRRCRSSIVLMGCSSGKLLSVNAPKNVKSGHVSMHYEPEGVALSYLCAGAPCVVGNLWDVTDRDIDRYCITLLEKFLLSDQKENGQKTSLPECVAAARDACKMRYIVGCAPVCYGVPVRCANKINT